MLDYETKSEAESIINKFKDLKSIINLEKKLKEAQEVEKALSSPDVWSDQNKAKKLGQQLSIVKKIIDNFKSLESKVDELSIAIELSSEDEEYEKEVRKLVKELKKDILKTELETMLSGEHDINNCFLTIHAGAGGTESHDWADMLSRMYLRWCERNGYKFEIIDHQPGDEAGTKSVTYRIVGDFAYGKLKCEQGVHRLVRISPFDSAKRRHTSFASVTIVPEIDEDIDIKINPEDLKIDTYRSSGAGGQHINKTDSAVRITHLPTGIVVTCQNQRSQIMNKETALKVLKAKLYELEKLKKDREVDELRGNLTEIAWGNQIRSYVFHPYKMVKDHRTNYETGNVDAVMDGDIDGFINAYLKLKAAKKN
jgi:peptide chain release factor 2